MFNDISIIIPVYHAKNTLKKTLKSILVQKLNNDKLKIEIILSVDDQKDYSEFIKSNFKNIKIKLITTKKNCSGAGNARNIGMKMSTGKYIGFLDSDDEYSKNYIQEMYDAVKRHNIVIAETHVYHNEKKIGIYEGKQNGLLNLTDISNNPGSFHPFLKKQLAKNFINKPSQDVFNIAGLLNKKPIKMIKNVYYKLNLRKDSFTENKHYWHMINLAYKFYQIKSIKEKKYKIGKQFAVRRIINNNFIKWKVINKNKSYYEYLTRRKDEKRKNLCV